MSEATFYSNSCVRDLTAAADYDGGQVIQLADGRAAVPSSDVDSGAKGGFTTQGIHKVTKTENIVILDGGKVYWDHSANAAHFKKANDRDFYIGVAVGDADSSDTEMYVDLNVQPSYTLDLKEGFRSLVVLTAGSPRLLPNGNGLQMTFSATAEAQKLDALSYDGVSPSANAIVEARMTVVDGGDAAALDINVGLASATHATDADSIAESLFVHIDGASTNINIESDDGTTEVAATDSTIDYTAGTAFEVWFDLRDPADIQVYIDGVNVLPSSVFKLNAATGPLKLLAHMEKSSDDTTANLAVDWLRARTMEQ